MYFRTKVPDLYHHPPSMLWPDSLTGPVAGTSSRRTRCNIVPFLQKPIKRLYMKASVPSTESRGIYDPK